MTITEKLLAANGVIEKEEKEIVSKRLSKLIGEEAKIKIREISGRKFGEIRNRKTDNGFDTNLFVCLEGIVEPDMKNEMLMKHFGAVTPKELVEKMFDLEAAVIADKIVRLSGFDDESEMEEEVKN